MLWILLWIFLSLLATQIVLYLIAIAPHWDSLNEESALQENEEEE